MTECAHEWTAGWELGCDDCGSHPAVHCPVCGDVRDLIMEEDPRE